MGTRWSSSRRLLRPAVASLALAGGLLAPAHAHADLQHTVARGHTLAAIAGRYRVTKQSIMDANHLTETTAKRIQPGDVLTIPKVDPPKGEKGKAKAGLDGKAKSDGGKDAKSGKTAKKAEPKYDQRPKTPGVIHLRRIATQEERDIKVAGEGRNGKVSPGVAKTFERLLRSPSGMSHPIDARLIAMLGVISNHFGSRKIEVVSGFRPYTSTQYTRDSRHNHGKAIDFRVVGVPNEVTRDFCRTLKNVGCGYYPNSVFVHMDVRTSSAFWIDYSKPGEAPRYNAKSPDADEGTSDVHDEMHKATGATPTDPPPADIVPAPGAGESKPLEPDTL